MSKTCIKKLRLLYLEPELLVASESEVTLSSSFPEARSYISKFVPYCMFVQPLVGCAVFQTPQMLDIRTDLDVIEIALVHHRRNPDSSAIPRDLEARMLTMHVLRQLVDIFRFGITSHEAHASDIVAIFADELIDGWRRQRLTYVGPQILAMTSRTSAWAIGDVDGERHLIRNLLKDDSCIDIFQHIGWWLMCVGRQVLSLHLKLLLACIETTCGLFLTRLREVAHALQISNDTRHVIHVCRVALRALMQVALVPIPRTFQRIPRTSQEG